MESIRQLRHVIALAEHRHFGRAADAAGITQAALTQSIKKLEENYGVALFDRRYRDVTPTSYGNIVLETARGIVLSAEHMQREIDLARNMAFGRLIIGCDPYFADALLAPALSRLLARFPKLAFTLKLGGWATMQAKLLTRTVDLYIGFANENADTRLELEGHELPPFLVFCRDCHPLAGREGLLIEDLLPYLKAVGPPSGWFVRKFRPFYKRSGISADRMTHNLVTSDMGIMKRLVATSDVLGLGLRQSVHAELISGQFRCLTIDELDFGIHIAIAWEQRRSLPPAAQALIEEVRSEVQELRLVG